MKGLHRAIGLLLIPLLVALMAAPVAAAPGNGMPKTVAQHPSWFQLDPVPAYTDDARITLTGKIAGNFPVTIENAGYTYRINLKGHFAVPVDLVPGENRIRFTGTNPGGRLLSYEVIIQKGETGDGGENGGGGDSGGGDENGSGGPVGSAYQIELQLGSEPFVADGHSQMTVKAIVTDLNGHLVPLDDETIHFTTTDASVVQILTPDVPTVDGVAVATIQAGTESAMVFVTASSESLGSVTIPVIPSP